jgi:RNA polymerase sigma-70 factor (ECF subfamily)
MSNPNPDRLRWFTEEVQPHEASLRAYLRGLFPSLPDLDDLVQESYLRLLRAKNAGRISFVKAFLFTTARNAALDIFRRRQVVSIEPIGEIGRIDLVEEQPDAAESIDKQQQLELLADAIRQLPARCRQVMTLRLLYGLPRKQIAAELRISEHTVKAQIAKGLRRCADYFSAHGLPTTWDSKGRQNSGHHGT